MQCFLNYVNGLTAICHCAQTLFGLVSVSLKIFFNVRCSPGISTGLSFVPLLFLIFINDIVSSVNSSELFLFADDLKLFKGIHSFKDCDVLQSVVTSVLQWCKNY
ncbi:unnamed protein product [Ixodes hexagonus]